ncbi:hypothetical protein SLS62_002310 [Diatrype stigma]|uniref:Glycosyl transferase family 25 domain-containing protein n=1 Tax=Diatrype stigma TaxID=117547 RepID=A0AAN9V703_9PEZI
MGTVKHHSSPMHQWPRTTTLGIAALALVAIFFLFTPRATYPSLDTQQQQQQDVGRQQQQTPPIPPPQQESEQKQPHSSSHSLQDVDTSRVTNGSLGFSKIFVVGLPERSDKRDAMTLTSALTGFHIDFVDGVRGETIPDKAVPFGVTDRKKFMETNLGSWRGHMNAIRRIIEEDLESALIMEDDMDWDVRLKSQLEQAATGAREIANASKGSTPRSPYGDDWDILWLGHCGEVFPETLEENRNRPASELRRMKHKYTINNDPTVPPPNVVTGFQDFQASPHTRWVHVTGAPICTFAYALSQRGARKVLYALSVDGLKGTFDNELAGICRRAVAAAADGNQEASNKGGDGGGEDRGLDAKCITVTPPLFFHHKAKGPMSGDSDIQTVSNNGVREKGFTENIMWSARNNLQNMILGREMESQF